jgi:hypothetical protein
MRAGSPIIRLSESLRCYAFIRAGAEFIPPLKAEGFLWHFCNVETLAGGSRDE